MYFHRIQSPLDLKLFYFCISDRGHLEFFRYGLIHKMTSEMDSSRPKIHKKCIFIWFYHHYISSYTTFVFRMETILKFSSMTKFEKITSEMDSLCSITLKNCIFIWFYHHSISNHPTILFWVVAILNFSNIAESKK